jgi:hypothetical protein
MPYLDAAAFATLTELPGETVEWVEDSYPGWLDAQLALASATIDARLRKRYDAPFAEPYPLIVRSWLARMIAPKLMRKRGVDALDEQYIDIRDDAKAAEEEIKEAADSETGLYDLPLRADTDASGISKGGPYAFSEASPYVWTDRQGRTGRDEDRRGDGSHG